jgi:hypothetical protein
VTTSLALERLASLEFFSSGFTSFSLFLSIDCVFLFLIQGLECRGFADSIFGMSVVFASIVMYDAQVWLFCLLFLC